MIRGDRRGSRQAKIKSAKRRADVIGRYLKGERVEDIADDLAIPKRTAWNDISTLLEEYKHHAAKDAEAHVGKSSQNLRKLKLKHGNSGKKAKPRARKARLTKQQSKSVEAQKLLPSARRRNLLIVLGIPGFYKSFCRVMKNAHRCLDYANTWQLLRSRNSCAELVTQCVKWFGLKKMRFAPMKKLVLAERSSISYERGNRSTFHSRN